MNKRLTIACLLLTSLSLHCYSYEASYETQHAYLHLGNNQKFSNKSSVGNAAENFIAQFSPIAASLIAVTKFIVSRINNRKKLPGLTN